MKLQANCCQTLISSILVFMISLVLFLCLMNTNFSYSQKMEDLSDLKTTDSIYSFVDKDATFPGGMPALMKFIHAYFIYPEGYGDIDVIGKVYVKFVVRKTGHCTDFYVLRGIQDQKLERAVVDMLKKMPAWKAAEINGREVDSYYLLPVNICFE